MAKPVVAKKSLAERLLAQSKSPFAKRLAKSFLLQRSDTFYSTHIPMLNLALSGDINKGLPCGITTIAAPPKHFKSILGLHCVEAFLKAEPEGVVTFYDSEFGITKEYLSRFDLDWDRINHIPIQSLEELRTELSNLITYMYDEFKETKKINDKVMIFVDSIGNLPSLKEVEDAENDKQSADFTRAKVIKSIFRIITGRINMLSIPMVVINHTYDTIEMFSKIVVSGGKGIQYGSLNILTVTKAQETNSDKEITGYKFTIVPLMSRYVKEKTKMPLYAYYDRGVPKYTGLLDVAKLEGIVTQCKVGVRGAWKFVLDGINGEADKEFVSLTADVHDSEELWGAVLKYTDFEDRLKDRFCIASTDVPTVTIEPEHLEINLPDEEYEEDD